MAKLERKKFKVFGENAPLDEIGQFGSAKATTKKNTKDIEEIQELDAWSDGWGGAVISNKNYPPMEEMTGAMNVMSYQTAYTLQEGIPEWNKDTTYYKGSIVKNLEGEDVKLYQSISNDNLNNPLSNTDNWSEISFGTGLEVCDIGMALYVDETKGLRRYLNGQIVDINANTQAFLNRLKEITTLHPSLLCTEEEWQTAKTMSAFGQVGKFVFNYSGDNIVSVRLPRVVNVQGLFDLQKLGMTVSAGLPNITGNVGGVRNDDASVAPNGAFDVISSAGNFGAGGGKLSNVNFNASRSSSIYGNSNTVQQEAIQYPYFIQIATGSETENNIINEIELNNPYSLFDSKYSDHELNNLSWLKSEGQWNAKATYPTAYDKLLKVYNGTETVEGLSVKLSTETYTDYDFVLNTTDETFRLPLLDGSENILSNERINYDLPTASGQTYTAQYNGSVQFDATTTGASQYIRLTNKTSGQITEQRPPVNGVGSVAYIAVKNGDVFQITGDVISTVKALYLIKAKGNGSLYFYVGETVQNANLIDAGRIGEQLATKTDKVQAAAASMPSSRFIDLTLGASGTTYTAPANGYFSVSKVSGITNAYIQLANSATWMTSITFANTAVDWVIAWLPAKKGDVIEVVYSATGKTNGFTFIYAEGEQ